MPTPKPGEQKKDFIGRCIAHLTTHEKEKFPTSEQRAAVCYSIYDRANESTSIGRTINKYLYEEESTESAGDYVFKKRIGDTVQLRQSEKRSSKFRKAITDPKKKKKLEDKIDESAKVVTVKDIIASFGGDNYIKKNFTTAEKAYSHILKNVSDLKTMGITRGKLPLVGIKAHIKKLIPIHK